MSVNPSLESPLLIFGASARAAAFSALRAQILCATVDLFADSDLVDRCRARRVSYYPGGLAEVALRLSPTRWMYTGALENHPDVVQQISSRHRLLGNSLEVLQQVRDPVQLYAGLREHSIAYPEVRTRPPATAEFAWLVKPRRSAGGARVRAWAANEATSAGGDDLYWQRLALGKPCSAAFVASADRTRLLGMTEQLIGVDWAGAEGYQYAGSIGPLWISAALRLRLQRIGEVLRSLFSLRGLFGVDFLLAEGEPTVVEVNPRYTASMEVLERVGGWSAVALHVAACEGRMLVEAAADADESGQCLGKAILFAKARLEVTPDLAAKFETLRRQDCWGPALADIPALGTVIQPRQPIASIFASAPDPTTTLCELKRQAAVFEQLLAVA